jgi:hypothetical protein
MKNIETIMKAWQSGKSARTPSLWTDGRVVYSYNLPIIATDKDGEVLVTANDFKAPSKTTARHVSQCRAWAIRHCVITDATIATINLVAKNTELTFNQAWIAAEDTALPKDHRKQRNT